MSAILRGLTVGDVPAWAHLLRTIEDEDRTGVLDDEASLAESLASPLVDPDRDLLGAFEGPDLVGHCWVFARTASGGTRHVELGGAVRPDRRGRGIGTRLVTAMLDRARDILAEDPDTTGHLEVRGLADHHEQATLLGRHGLVPHHWSFRMRTKLTEGLGGAPLPAGLELSPLVAERDAQRVLAAHNLVFLDHPGFSGWSAQEWEHFAIAARAARHDASFVVTDATDTVVAYLMTTEYDAHTRATGRREAYVQRLGVRREQRGRGVAAALLTHALETYRSAGYDDAALDVLADNPTGALRLYQRMGFETVSRWTGYRLVEPPVG